MPKPNSLKSVHFTALDGVRGLAVLMVMFFHFFQRENFREFAFGHTLTTFSRIGQTGVDLFFVLSGFLITGILIDAKGSAHFSGIFMFGGFYGSCPYSMWLWLLSFFFLHWSAARGGSPFINSYGDGFMRPTWQRHLAW
jgi:surface polysaccharide O-acyltransferase-like enzyme